VNNGNLEPVSPGTTSVVWRTRNNRSAMLSQPTLRSACQFVYRGIVGAICRARNNRGPIFSPPTREPMIQKVAKYGMRDPYMIYKNFMSVLYKTILSMYYSFFEKKLRAEVGGFTTLDFTYFYITSPIDRFPV
jgi:hypothetical protein